MQVQTKRPGEARTYEFDFSQFPEIEDGDTLSGTPAVASATSGLTIGSPSRSGSSVLVSISGGSDGVGYNLTCSCATTGGSTLNCVGKLKVSSFG